MSHIHVLHPLGGRPCNCALLHSCRNAARGGPAGVRPMDGPNNPLGDENFSSAGLKE